MTLVAGLVLAGGKALRLGGGDKCLLPLAGGTILDVLIRRIRPQVAALAISANGDPARFASCGAPVLPDLVEGQGPLGGVLSGLHWAAEMGAGSLLTVPGDTPFVPPDLVARLGAAPAWATNDAGVHHLVAVWPVEVRSQLTTYLESSAKVWRFGASIGTRSVVFDDVPDPFLNINTPADLARARDLA